MIRLGKDKKEEIEEEESTDSIVDLLGSLQSGPEQRSIMFVGEINEEKAADLISALLVLSQEKEEQTESQHNDLNETDVQAAESETKVPESHVAISNDANLIKNEETIDEYGDRWIPVVRKDH